MTERIKGWLDSDSAKIFSKLVMACLIPWMVWVTRGQIEDAQFRNKGDRFSQLDGALLEMKLDKRIDALPPPDWRDRINSLEREIEQLERAQRHWIDEMSRDFVRKDER